MSLRARNRGNAVTRICDMILDFSSSGDDARAMLRELAQLDWDTLVLCDVYTRGYEHRRVLSHLTRARLAGLPATLTLGEWLRTCIDFDWQCAYCGHSEMQIMEHVVAIRDGGGTTADNCVPACTGCNNRKTRGEVGSDDLDRVASYLATRHAAA